MRPVLLVAVLSALCCASCQGGKRFYPVRGRVLVDGKAAEGVSVVFHPQDTSDEQPVQPSAITQADGSFVLRTFVVQQRVLQEGAQAGKYRVTCIWYPPDLQKYLGNMQNLPDKLHGGYADPKTSILQAEIQEGPTELPPFQLKAHKD